ncbi:cell surface protein SprA [candidate division KSB1 bacterium]|nr:cell surface protein SprA [candidate division KSB1 bacterium]
MNQTQRFTVTGKIGEKVTVNVDQDSERSFDFDNNLKLNYTGFEDEVIQSIEAGNISLALPGTRFVRASGGSAGLFGIKTKMKLGDLEMTVVASQEKGESSELSINGGAASNKSTIKDLDFKEFTYFFLDKEYRNNFQNYASKWLRYAIADPIKRIFVYRSTTDFTQTGLVKGWALPNPATKSDTLNSGSKEYFTGSFIPLEAQLDYFVESDMGYIYMAQPVQSGEVLAVAYETEKGIIVGDVDYDPDSSEPIFLKIIKTQSPHPDDEYTWDLAWKNVYNLGSRNIPQEGFAVRILRQGSTGDEEAAATGETFLNIFGLDNYDENGGPTPDAKIDVDPYLVNLARGELIFPYLEPFNPTDLGGDLNAKPPLAEDLRIPQIYELEKTAPDRRSASKFVIEVESQNKSSTYQLGFNVIENSEKVIANGRTLQRGVGYTIEYMSGTLTILDEAATAPSAKLDITYERNQFFQLDKKTMLGARAEYKFGEDHFLGATFMYLNERTLDQKVRVGKGPMRNMIWDVNGSFKFKPNFLTRAVDALPLLRADADSRLNFEGEIAQIIPNPNTLNNNSTGDNQGVAYIDDFEGAERPTPLGIMRKSWTDASAPVPIQKLFGDPKHVMAQRGKLIWYNPYTRVSITDIWPEREVNSQTGQLTDVLIMEFTPTEYKDPAESTSRPLNQSWHGVMRALSSGYFNQTESKFLEITVAGSTGKLNIDLGIISEDVIPNGKLDSEDIPVGGVRLGTLDEGEDIGLDGMQGSDTGDNPDFWDIDGSGTREPWEPLSNDDWSYSQSSGNYTHINGTENSKNDGSQIPDTEDLNRNNVVDRLDSYFSYHIDLDDTNNPYFVGYTNPHVEDINNRYRLYRIPLQVLPGATDTTYRSLVSKPDLSNIQYARLWMGGVDSSKTVRIKIAEINLTGNDWKEQGISETEDFTTYPNPDGTIDDETVSVSVLNTHDNPDNYLEPPGVSGVVDRITKARAKEQALAISVKDLQAGWNGLVKKTLLEPQDWIHYKNLKMFVGAYGENMVHDTTAVAPVEFYLRFGSDEKNYYEIRQPLYGPTAYEPVRSVMWSEFNEIDVPLFDLTSMKMMGDDIALIDPADSTNQIYVKKVGRKEYRFKGIPSISNVRVFWVGIVNKSGTTWSGEVWLNELRLSNIEKEKGIAMRASVDFGLSDLFSVNAEINRQDADFHNVGERFGKGSTAESYSVSGSMKMDKFLPQSWGLSIPVSANYRNSKTTPKYDPALGDIVLENSSDETLLDEKLTRAEDKGINISISKPRKSHKFYIKYTLDALQGKVSHNRSKQTAPTMKLSNSQNWSGNVDYNITFGQNTFVSPLKFLKGLPLISKYGDTKLYYLPRSFTAGANGSSKWSERQTRSLQGEDGLYTSTSTKTLNKNANLSLKLTEKLSGNISRAWVGDVRGGWFESITSSNDTTKYIDRSKNQNFKLDFSPEIFSFFTNTFGYSSTYQFSNNPAQKDRALSASTNNTVSASGTLKFGQIFSRKSSGSKSRTTTTRRKPPGRAKPGEKKDDTGEKEGEEKEKKSRPNPLKLLKSLVTNIGSVRDVKVTYSDRNNYTNAAIKTEPGNAYKFGFVDDNYVRSIPYSESATGNIVGVNATKSLNLSTGFQVTKAIDVSLKYDLTDQATQSTQTTGNYSQSALRIKDEHGDTNDVFIPFPDITLTWNGVEKIGPLSKFFKSINLSSNFSFKTATYWRDNKENKTKDDYQLSQRPLIRASMTLTSGITSSFAMNHSVGEGQAFTQKGDIVLLNTGDRNTTDDINFSASYSKRSGFSLPIPFLSKKKLDNSVDISITYTSSSTRGERWNKTENKWEEFTSSDRWSLQPKMTYSFSTRVKGGAHFELGENKSKLSGTTKIKEFLIDVNISIRGN